MKLAVLNLEIRRKWLEMIVSGEKREEYRRSSATQCFSLYIGECATEITSGCFITSATLPQDCVVIFRNGYHIASRAIAVELKGLSLRMSDSPHPRHIEWGEPLPETREGHIYYYHTLKLGRVVAAGTYEYIKAITINRRTERGRRIWSEMLKRLNNGATQGTNIGAI